MVILSNENSAGPSSLTAHPDSDSAVAITSILRCRDVMVESFPHAVYSGAAAWPVFLIGRSEYRRTSCAWPIFGLADRRYH